MAEAPFDPERFRLDLEVDRSNLSEAFAQQAALYAYYAECHVRAMRAAAAAKLMVEVVEAKLDKTIRDELTAQATAEGGKLPTVDQIKSRIRTSPDWVKAQRALIDADATEQLAKAACESFRQRRDMLVQIGAHERQELQGDLVMKGTGDRVRDALADKLKERMS